MPLEAYFDESGIHRSATYCVVAGASGGARAWERFEGQWRSALDAFGVPVFHSKEFFARKPNGDLKGVYSGWTEGDAAEFMRRLLEAFEESRNLRVVGAALEVAPFRACNKVQRVFLTNGSIYRRQVGDELPTEKLLSSGKPDAPFFLPFRYTVDEARKQAQKSGSRVYLFFDRQDQYKDWAGQVIDGMKQAPAGKHISGYQFANKEEVVSLQVADLIAYTCRRWAEGKSDGREASVFRRIEQHERVMVIDEAAIKRILAQQFPSWPSGPQPPSERSPSGV